MGIFDPQLRTEYQVELLLSALAHAALERHHGNQEHAEKQMVRWMEAARPLALMKIAERRAAQVLTEVMNKTGKVH